MSKVKHFTCGKAWVHTSSMTSRRSFIAVKLQNMIPKKLIKHVYFLLMPSFLLNKQFLLEKINYNAFFFGNNESII